MFEGCKFRSQFEVSVIITNGCKIRGLIKFQDGD